MLILAAWFAGPGPGRSRARERRSRRSCASSRNAAFAISLGGDGPDLHLEPDLRDGKPAGIIVFTLLALLGTEVLIRETAREFPDARPGAASAAIRARLNGLGWRRHHHSDPAASAPARPTTAEQLGQLADLFNQGAIDPDEYRAAKAQVLRG